MKFLTLDELNLGLEEIQKSPMDMGRIELIVRRPDVDLREEPDQVRLIEGEGMEGDNWRVKPSSSMPDGSAHPEKEITIMNSRAISLIAQTPENRKWAGDQIYADLNLGYGNLPPGTLLRIGTVLLEVTEPPHRGCKKFALRYGQDAVRFVNSDAGKSLNLRGINTRIVQGGTIRVGDIIQKAAPQLHDETINR